MVTLPRHALTNIHMHAHADGQPENIMPLAQSVGWTIAQTTETGQSSNLHRKNALLTIVNKY